MILALILAATISSPSIGEIVTLPEWMPTSIAASDTPGGGTTNAISRRMTQQALASVAAAEEAYFERLYYLHATDETLTAGSTTIPGLGSVAADEVWYRSRLQPSPLFPEADGSYGASKAADREFPSTLRFHFPEHDWLRERLVGFTIWGDALDVISQYFPPSGGSALISADYGVLTSSLVDFAPPSFPEFDWTEVSNVAATLSSWRGGRTLHACRDEGIFQMYSDRWTYAVDYLHPPGFTQLANYLPAAEYTRFESEHRIAQTNPYASFLHDAYDTTLDYAIITNRSKRLLFERMAAFNQIAASADRTYSSSAAYTTSGGGPTNTGYRIKAISTGELPGSDIILVNGEPQLSSSASIAWLSDSTDVTITNKPATMGVGKIWEGITDIAISPYCVSYASGGSAIATARVGQDAIDGIASVSTNNPMVVSFTVTDYSPTLSNPFVRFDVTQIDINGPSRSYNADLTIGQVEGEFMIEAGATAEYDYTRTNPANPFRTKICYPALAAFDSGRVRETELAICWWSFEGHVDYPEDIDPLPNDYRASRLRCARDTFTSWDDEQAAVQREYNNVRQYAANRLHEHLGFWPYDWQAVAALASDIKSSAVRNVRLSASMDFSYGTNLTATIYKEGNPQTNRVEFSNGTGIIGAYDVTIDATVYSTPATNIPGHAIAVRPMSMLRTDWSFRALGLDLTSPLNEE